MIIVVETTCKLHGNPLSAEVHSFSQKILRSLELSGVQDGTFRAPFVGHDTGYSFHSLNRLFISFIIGSLTFWLNMFFAGHGKSVERWTEEDS